VEQKATCCQKSITMSEAILNHGLCNECMDKGVEISNTKQINEHTVKKAEHQVCRCPSTEYVVYIDTIEGSGEFPDGLDGLYCTNCNSFWREP
jgi:hypothetical protein